MKLAWCDVIAFFFGLVETLTLSSLGWTAPWKTFFAVWIFLRVVDGLLNGPNRRASAEAARLAASKMNDWQHW